MDTAARYLKVKGEVERQCREVGRPVDAVRLVAVSKIVDLPAVEDAMSAGAMDFGENRPDELLRKQAAFPQATWHFIGNIQSRRIDDIVSAAALIHSVNHLHHAQKIDRVASSLGKVQDILVEVNVSGEASKSGVTPSAAVDFVRACCELESVRVRGLMTMAPEGDLRVARACFHDLAVLRQDIAAMLPDEAKRLFSELSMGMSEDWREAIAEGATIVRIGRAIMSADFREE